MNIGKFLEYNHDGRTVGNHDHNYIPKQVTSLLQLYTYVIPAKELVKYRTSFVFSILCCYYTEQKQLPFCQN